MLSVGRLLTVFRGFFIRPLCGISGVCISFFIILSSFLFYAGISYAQPAGTSIRFFGTGTGYIDRVLIPIDNPEKPADVGGSFTIEFWMKSSANENNTGRCETGSNGDGWTNGHTIVDRDIFGSGDFGDFGISLGSDGRLGFGVNRQGSGNTICTSGVNVKDNRWHHIAVTRDGENGAIAIYVDGIRRASGSGPTGNISYRNGRTTSYQYDPYIVLGAEKHDYSSAYPSFNGLVDDLRISSVVRYTGSSFQPPSEPHILDNSTVALYRFDGSVGVCSTGTVIYDEASGRSNGTCRAGGSNNGPQFSSDTPFLTPSPTSQLSLSPTAPPLPTNQPTATPVVTPSPTAALTQTPTIAGQTATPSQSPISPTPTTTGDRRTIRASWRPISNVNAPVDRAGASFVWTGRYVIVWGGVLMDSQRTRLNTGAIYDTQTDTWRPMSTTNAPAPRYDHSSVWTGTEMIVWGGMGQNFSPFNTGGRYILDQDRWLPLAGCSDQHIEGRSPCENAPHGRTGHSAQWINGEMVIWGGKFWQTRSQEVYLNTGAAYNPTTDRWSEILSEGAPAPRAGHLSARVLDEMVVFQGFATVGGLVDAEPPVAGGALYKHATNPSERGWRPLTFRTSPAEIPNPQTRYVITEWKNSSGENIGFILYSPSRPEFSRMYNLVKSEWYTMGMPGFDNFESPVAPPEVHRRSYGGVTGVWAENDVIYWGTSASEPINQTTSIGSVFRPSTGEWFVLNYRDPPPRRSYHYAVWIGSGMLIWGGQGGTGQIGTGEIHTIDFPTLNIPSPQTTPNNRCETRKFGDVNCDGAVNEADVQRWREEYLGATDEQTADVDGQSTCFDEQNSRKSVCLADLEIILRNQGYPQNVSPSP
ncbi:MAG: LamG domain-containing protein [Patescibacteria group bacterium]|nr:LamG domain-containing protein [Patescibacteria group bacterium]